MLSTRVLISKKIFDNFDWVSFVFWRIILENLFLSVIFFKKSYREDISSEFINYCKKIKYFLINEFFDQLANFTDKYALSILSPVIVVSISSTRAIFVLLITLILTHIFKFNQFKENLSTAEITKKIICFIFISFGVFLTVM